MWNGSTRRRIADLGRKNVLANGARLEGNALVIPHQTAQTQPLEYFRYQ